MGSQRPGSLVLDSGALIGFERSDRRVVTLIELCLEHGRSLHIPAGVVAQVWRDGSRQVRLARLVRSRRVTIDALDLSEAQGVGAVCGLSQTSDIVDASVVLVARRHRAPVVTSDPEDLLRIDPAVVAHRC